MRKPHVLPAVDDACLSLESKVQVHRLQAASEVMLDENIAAGSESLVFPWLPFG